MTVVIESEIEITCMRCLYEHTSGQMIYLTAMNLLKDIGIDVTKLVYITMDGAEAMVSHNAGVVSLFQVLFPHVLSFHCILHHEVRCAKHSAIGETSSMSQNHQLHRKKALDHETFKLLLSKIVQIALT